MSKTHRLGSSLQSSGSLTARLIRPERPPLLWKLRNFPNVWRGLWRHKVAEALGIGHFYGTLEAVLIRGDGTRVNYGLVSTRVVTDAFAADVVDNLQAGAASFQNYDFHGSGIGTTAEAATETALVNTTGAPARVSGTASEPAANQYRNIATVAYTSALAITEHGLFSALTLVTMMDRSVFAAINVVNLDSIQFTYTLTVASGG